MRRMFVTTAIGLATCVAVCVAVGSGGCAANSGRLAHSHSTKGSATNNATTPQDKTHEDQLTAMGREDAQSAPTSGKKIKPRKMSRRRRTGQGIVDQPIKR